MSFESGYTQAPPPSYDQPWCDPYGYCEDQDPHVGFGSWTSAAAAPVTGGTAAGPTTAEGKNQNKNVNDLNTPHSSDIVIYDKDGVQTISHGPYRVEKAQPRNFTPMPGTFWRIGSKGEWIEASADEAQKYVMANKAALATAPTTSAAASTATGAAAAAPTGAPAGLATGGAAASATTGAAASAPTGAAAPAATGAPAGAPTGGLRMRTGNPRLTACHHCGAKYMVGDACVYCKGAAGAPTGYYRSANHHGAQQKWNAAAVTRNWGSAPGGYYD